MRIANYDIFCVSGAGFAIFILKIVLICLIMGKELTIDAVNQFHLT